MAAEVPVAGGCCEKAGRRWDHGGRWHGRQVWRQKMSRKVGENFVQNTILVYLPINNWNSPTDVTSGKTQEKTFSQ